VLHPSDMSVADLRSLRKYHLAMEVNQLALVLGTDARDGAPGPGEAALARSTRKRGALNRDTIRRWETDDEATRKAISAPNAEALARLIRYTQDVEDALAAAHAPGAVIPTYRTDEALHSARPDLWPALPATWHQAAAWRAAERIGGSTAYTSLPTES
jgi:hypothetical protein